jgi:hypothetical protein
MQKAATETATAFRRSNQLGADSLCATVNVSIPENVSSQVGHHHNQLKRLYIMTKSTRPGITPSQMEMELSIAAEREINGIGMGVLSDGAAFLTLRGLARMCGLPNSVIVRVTGQWQDTPLKPREHRIRELVREHGADDSRAFIAIKKDGVVQHAVPDAVCMAVLEYYAFEAGGESSAHAAKSYRTLARKGFKDFIYAQVGYNPTGRSDIAWQQFHDRVSLSYHTVPDGYFSVFKELADITVTLIRAGADLGPHFIPDISVGIAWGKHWTTNNLDAVYGARMKYDHNYPSYFPQAASNPQTPYCYPDEALAEFRDWIKKEYTPRKMPTYILGKVKDGQIPGPAANAALAALTPKQIAPPKIRPQRF